MPTEESEPAEPKRPGPDVPVQRPSTPAEDPSAARYELLLNAARDLPRITNAYDAELLVSTVVGAPYAIADRDRTRVLVDTIEGLRRYLARRRSRPATLLRAVLGVLAGQSPPDRDEHARTNVAALTPWLTEIGRVRPTGTAIFGDAEGRQVTYLASFAYTDADVGGPEHLVAAVVDHDLGHVKDLFVAAPAATVLSQLAAAATADPGLRLADVDPRELREVVERYLAVTDELPELPDARSLTSDRALAGLRLRLLENGAAPVPAEVPAPTAPATDSVDEAAVLEFRRAPEAGRLSGVDAESVAFALRLVTQYESALPGRPWTADAIEDFLLEWIPGRALLDRTDIRTVPAVLSAWVRWSGRVGGLSPRDVAVNVAAVARHRSEFARRVRRGAERSPAVAAMEQLLRDGVDVNDDKAVAAWLDEYNERDNKPSDPGV